MSAAKKDTLQILDRIYQYQADNNIEIKDVEDNVYAKFRFNVERRNWTLWLIPTMYVMAKDPREYIRESYSKVRFRDSHHFDINNQVVTGTIRKNRKAMPTLLDYATPNIYDIALYDGHMLSPFNKINRKFYRFKQKPQKDGTTRLEFKPRLYNTQLVNGFAFVDTKTGRIIKTLLNGEFDMISFRTHITLGEKGPRSLMPQEISTAARFRFMGNRIAAIFNANYDCPTELPDSIKDTDSKALMDSIRPIPLNETDRRIYEVQQQKEQEQAQQAAAEEAQRDSTAVEKTHRWRDFWWHTVGDNLVTPLSTESENAEFYLTPIINPLYVRYSGSRGLSYKMRLYTKFVFSSHRYLNIEPTFGYNFKQRQFYFTIPVRMTYNPKRNGYAEIIYGNGNRISNSTVMDKLHEELSDTINFDDTEIDKFTDNHLIVRNNIMLFDWLDLETGMTIHRRVAVDKWVMKKYNVPETYRSFAPSFGLKISPWLHKGPLIAIDWEKGIKGVNKSNIDYERWEMDAQWKYKIPGLRLLNMRFGYGFYTERGENYFLDYENFRDNNLPEGWNDDWSGNFQLLDGRIYNESAYYMRANVSYESPMLLLTWLPYFGKYIEKERLYVSNVILEKTRPYFELGYGFSNRYISVGLFASFFNSRIEKVGINFDFELFKRW
ncbi:MAG: hypothetical protein IJ618_06160 [Prevotella sp.]|nr:hypothetical protein [Prevotella sp.]